MRKLFPILLIGCLSMLFAEVFSGASQAWFINGWGMLVTFPLYLGHVLFFLWIALKIKKTSLSQLYLFGVLFALYESWITKVLWAGYMYPNDLGLGTFLGIGISEFLILVFFWHPIMSFILPILVFEILTNRVISEHGKILEKNPRKKTLIVLFLILISTFIANGNQFDLISSNLSLIGTSVLILGLYYLSRKTNLEVFKFSKTGFIIATSYLVLLYLTTFFLILPERIPKTIIPFISIIAFYIIPVFLILNSKKTEIELKILNKNQYSIRDLAGFTMITILTVNISCIVPNISSVILAITYYTLAFIGTIIFILAIYNTLKQSFTKKLEN